MNTRSIFKDLLRYPLMAFDPIVAAVACFIRRWRRLTIRQMLAGSAVAILTALVLKASFHTPSTGIASRASSSEDRAFSEQLAKEHAELDEREQQYQRALELAALSQELIDSNAYIEPGRNARSILPLGGGPPLFISREALTKAVQQAREDAPTLAKRAEEQRRLTSKLDRQLESLEDGNVAFNVPEHAKAYKAVPMEAKVHPTLPAKELIQQLQQPGRVDTAPLKISGLMTATLTGGSAFDISSCSPPEQALSDEEITTWCWLITPKAVGEQYLVLSFDAVVSFAGKDSMRSIKTFTRRIDVDVGWPESVGEWLELARKTAENLSYLWVAILVPIGAGAWAIVKKAPSRNKGPVPAGDGGGKADSRSRRLFGVSTAGKKLIRR